ncbi:MAG: response regulator transcription factor [Magnetococcales bacterium]|nr:response regulator transcription factor [Magnetococcales bacterium]
MRILVIEDNQDLVANMFDYLEGKGHVVDTAGDGVTGLHLALVNDYDVIVLDLILPGMDGITLCRKLRREGGKETPLLMLTARDSLEDKVTGLESGADDYVVKPFALREVETRLRALVRRAQGRVTENRLKAGNLLLDLESRVARRGERRLELPPIPFKLLEILLRRQPSVVSRADLEFAVWGDSPPDSDALKAHMHVLRDAVDKPGEAPLIRTVRGVGYQMADPDATSA